MAKRSIAIVFLQPLPNLTDEIDRAADDDNLAARRERPLQGLCGIRLDEDAFAVSEERSQLPRVRGSWVRRHGENDAAGARGEQCEHLAVVLVGQDAEEEIDGTPEAVEELHEHR